MSASKLFLCFIYYIIICCVNSSLIFDEHTIGVDSMKYTCTQGIDMDGDGDIDMIGSSYFDGDLSWFENDGNYLFQDLFFIIIQMNHKVNCSNCIIGNNR